MKKLVVFILGAMLVANVASAIVDPDINSMGVYFDENADVFQMDASGTAVPTYIILVNPDVGALYGFEFSLEIVGAYYQVGGALSGPNPLNLGTGLNYIVGTGGAMATTPATVLARVDLLPLGGELAITLKASDPTSTPGEVTPNVLGANDVIIPCGLSAGIGEDGMPNVCAAINGTTLIVATDEVSMDAVKALYR